MVERLRERVEEAREVAREVTEFQRQAPQPTATVQQNLEAAQAASRAVLESGPQAREQAVSARNLERRAEDRRLIMDVAGRHGVTLTEDQAEALRSSAWRAADRAAQSEETRDAAREAGQSEANFGAETQKVRDEMGQVIGQAAEEAAYKVIRARMPGLSEDAAREMAEQAGRREMRDAGAWTRAEAGTILLATEQEWAAPQEAAAEGEAGAAAPATVAVATEEVQAESEVSFSAMRLSFGYNVNAALLAQALEAVGGLEGAKQMLYLDIGDPLTRENVLRSIGLDLNGQNSFKFDTDRMISDGLVSQEELREFMDGSPQATRVFAFLHDKIMEGVSEENAPERFDTYVDIEGHENRSAFAALQAIDYLTGVQQELGSIASAPAEADEATRRQLGEQKGAISENVAARIDTLRERVDEWNNVLDQLRGKPDDMETTIVTPSGIERTDRVGIMRRDYQERLENDQNELARLNDLSRNPARLAGLVRRSGWRGEAVV